MRIIAIILLFLVLNTAQGQSACEIELTGVVKDVSTGEFLEFPNVYIDELEIGVTGDEGGSFIFPLLCPGEYHLRVSHIGCDSRSYFLNISRDTFIIFNLDHHEHLLHTVEVLSFSENLGSTTVSSTLKEKDISLGQGKELGGLIERLPGVNTIKTGANIIKPVIHGLYGQRIALVQNGLNLTSQRWGIGHAPELSIASANSITVVKGTESLEYGGEGLGGAVIINDGPPPSDPHLHGSVQYAFQTNGRGHYLSGQLLQKTKSFGWKSHFGGSLRGDNRAANYLLTNTGQQNLFGGIALNKALSYGSLNVKYNYYHNQVGILLGSLISNLPDLELAFERDEPFKTTEDFSYTINAPRQEVDHHTIQFSWRHNWSSNWRSELQHGFQWNRRQEFDLRRGGRTETPSLKLDLFSYQSKFIVVHENSNSILKLGIQNINLINRNDSKTGVLPLLPDYNNIQAGVFGTFKKRSDNWEWELGLRYDYRWNSVVKISSDIDRSVERFKNNFNSLMTSIGVLHTVNEHFNWSLNLGWTQRPPSVNELYSFGLHQGVASIEEGEIGLNLESGFKAVSRFRWHGHDHFWIEGSAYIQRIEDYIYLRPTEELRLTVRGAFPVFRYTQNDALLSGADISVVIPINHHLEWRNTATWLYGQNTESDEALIFIPQSNWASELTYQWNGSADLSVRANYVFEQSRFPTEQDFLDPPDGYFLLGASGKYDWRWKNRVWTTFFEVENALNSSYRNYLNRWRYFADDLGTNVRIGIKVEL